MTKRDFVLIADIIKSVNEDGALSLDSGVDCVRLAHEFAYALAKTNPAFDSRRFIDACTSAEDRAEYESETSSDPYL